jgi:hypothetical protein
MIADPEMIEEILPPIVTPPTLDPAIESLPELPAT